MRGITTICIGAAITLGASAASWASPYSAAVLADNPKTYWQMNESSGDTAADSAPTNGANDAGYRTGTGAGSAGGVTLGVSGAPIGDVTNTAASFNGTRTSGAVNGTTTFLSASAATMDTGAALASNYTVEFWFNNQRPEEAVNNAGNSVAGYLFNRGGTVGAADMIGIDGPLAGAGLVPQELFLFNGSTVLSTGFNPTEGTWYHLAFVRSGSSVNVYINGVALDLNGISPGTTGTLAATFATSDIVMAKRVDDFYPYQGLIDETAIYNTVLSAGQIQDHYASIPVPEPTTAVGLLAYAATIAMRRSVRRRA